VWNGFIYMAASDDSNPAHNGRRYELRCGADFEQIADIQLDTQSPETSRGVLRRCGYLAGAAE